MEQKENCKIIADEGFLICSFILWRNALLDLEKSLNKKGVIILSKKKNLYALKALDVTVNVHKQTFEFLKKSPSIDAGVLTMFEQVFESWDILKQNEFIQAAFEFQNAIHKNQTQE